MDGYLTIAQLAARLGIQPGSVRRMRLRGDIPEPDDRAGSSPVWRVETIEKWVASRPSATWKKGGATEK